MPNTKQPEQGTRQTEAPFTSHQHPSTAQPPRLIKLISVCLKEAALDSPSFRASCNYYSSQIDQTEHWIDGLLKSLKKYPQQFADFKEVNNILLNQLIPEFLRDGIIDQENTAAVLDTSKTNLSSLWSENLKLLDLDDTEVSSLLKEISKTHIKYYKDVRKNYEFFQNKYDTVLSKYASQSKTKEPSALREDAFQLFEVKKSYLGACLDLSVEMAKLHHTLDKSLIKLTELLLKDRGTFDEGYFAKVEAWSEATEKSVKSLLDDMIYSKKQIEEATTNQFTPTRDLNQHNSASINPATLTHYNPDIDDSHQINAHEKHGWLFMKTTVGKPARQIWVRRWVFVKNGIFGLFSLSPSKNYVQETDKIGVLLSNIRYAPDEDRRFCFEIKTIDITLTFQAESLKDLRSWLRVFSLEKQRAIENSDGEAGEYAFGRYPPVLYEFASTSLTSADVELTSSKVENTKNNDVHETLTSSHLSHLVGGNENLDFRVSSSAGEFREPDLNTPIFTKMTKVSILSRAFLCPTIIPTAVTANIWGSVNWGMYYMNNNVHHLSTRRNNLTKIISGDRYPSYYPSQLKKYDIQLKALFDTIIPEDELVVLQFSCLFSLNMKQELAGRCFITMENCYFYLNTMGFISLLKKPIKDLVAVDVSSEQNWDVLKVYGIEGLNMRGRLFFEDGKLIQKKMDLIINNLARDKPRPQSELITMIKTLETEEVKKAQRSLSLLQRKDSEASKKKLETDSFQNVQAFEQEVKAMKTNYKNEFTVQSVKIFDAPAKAIFHILFGDHSPVMKHSIHLVDNDEFNSTPWFPENGKLKRVIDYKIYLSNSILNFKGNQGNISKRSTQTLEAYMDSKYYRVQEVGSTVKLPFSDAFQCVKKYVIIENDTRSSKLYTYYNLQFPKGTTALSINSIYKCTLMYLENQEVHMLERNIEQCVEKLGSHGKAVKAIRTYGNLSRIDEKPVISDDEILVFGYNLLIKLYIKLFLYLFAKVVFQFINVLISASNGIFNELSANRVLVFSLSASLLFNAYLSGKSSVSYWTAKRAEHLVKEFTQEIGLNRMERSLSLNDVELLASYDFNNTSLCFTKYLEGDVKDEHSESVDIRFRESRHRIAVKRNELLVELKILEKMEKEIVAGGWKNYLLSEINLCKISLDDMHIDDPQLINYCSSCVNEFKKISELESPKGLYL